MRDAGILDELVLVGSWCLLAYRDHFADTGTIRTLRTRDLDFLVPIPSQLRHKVDMTELVNDLGFILGHRGPEGYDILQHPELMIEFLVPERGRGSAGVVELPMLGMNAQALRFMDIALLKILNAKLHGVTVRVPHPAAFALHRLLVAPRRKKDEGRQRDAEIAIHVLELLHKKGEILTLQVLLGQFPKSWQKTIFKELKAHERSDLVDALL
jgi:hypothetical protein